MDACQVYVARHFGCPFGAVASVHAWERIGAAVCFLARKLLMLAVLRYVDDYFAPERCVDVRSVAVVHVAHGLCMF